MAGGPCWPPLGLWVSRGALRWGLGFEFYFFWLVVLNFHLLLKRPPLRKHGPRGLRVPMAPFPLTPLDASDGEDSGLARAPYRVGGRSPSPTHTSDSDDTLTHKAKYYRYAFWVGRRWYAMVHFARRRCTREHRVVGCLAVLRLTGFVELVARRVVSFLPTVAGVVGRRLPRYNRYGILVSPRSLEGSGERIPWDPWGDSD